MRRKKSTGKIEPQSSTGENYQSETSEDVHLKYLELGIRMVRVMLFRAVRCWNLASQDPQNPVRGLVINPNEIDKVIQLPPLTSWGQISDLPDKERKTFDDALWNAIKTLEEYEASANDTTFPPRLTKLLEDFSLDTRDSEFDLGLAHELQITERRLVLQLLLLCLAPEIDTTLESIYGYIQDNVSRRRPTVQLLFKILGESGAKQLELARYLAPQHPLIKFKILEVVPEPNMPWVHQQVRIDETVLAWLLGYYRPTVELAASASLDSYMKLLAKVGLEANHPFDSITLPEWNRSTTHQHPPIFVVYGRDQMAQQVAAYRLAIGLKKPLLSVALDKAIAAGCPQVKAVQLALRDARLTNSVAFLCGWDACLNEGNKVIPEITEALCEHPGLIIIASEEMWHIDENVLGRPFFFREFAIPSVEVRKKLWRYFLDLANLINGQVQNPTKLIQVSDTNNVPSSQDVVDKLLDKVARSFALESGCIRDAAYYARSIAAQYSRLPNEDEIFAAARVYASPNLGTLAKRIDLRHTEDDLVLPTEQHNLLKEMASAIDNRQKVLTDWQVGTRLASSYGIVALFVGVSGTGKTLAAQIIAQKLGLPLYKIDLAMVVSKYIGETEKHLRGIFTEAASTNAILFFDEADSLFGKRTDIREAHDRFANQEVSDLLQRIESYDGVAILATNLLGNIDDAFKRRLQFIIDFPFPTIEERKELWKKLLSSVHIPGLEELIGTDKSNKGTDFSQNIIDLAQHELSGGNIRNAIVTAAYQAADCKENRLTMKNLEYGIQRELQKIGRLVDYNEFGSQMA